MLFIKYKLYLLPFVLLDSSKSILPKNKIADIIFQTVRASYSKLSTINADWTY